MHLNILNETKVSILFMYKLPYIGFYIRVLQLIDTWLQIDL